MRKMAEIFKDYGGDSMTFCNLDQTARAMPGTSFGKLGLNFSLALVMGSGA